MLNAVGFAHAYSGGLFDDALAVGHGMELRLQRPTLDWEGGVTGQPVLEGYGTHALKELVEAACGEAPQFEQYALGKARPYVCSGKACHIRFKEHAPVFGRDRIHSHMSQFVAERAFQPKETGRAEPYLRAGVFLDHSESPSEPFFLSFCFY